MPDSQCRFCGKTKHADIEFRRGRRGRPYQRMVQRLRADGAHICWICGLGINMALPVNDRMSWTLDHYYPLVVYPCLGLRADNHREAHRACNSSKCDALPTTMHGVTTRQW